MTVPDASYTQRGTYHEFLQHGGRNNLPANWLEVYTEPDRVSFFTHSPDYLLHLNLSDARILRDILTEHIARQERKPA